MASAEPSQQCMSSCAVMRVVGSSRSQKDSHSLVCLSNSHNKTITCEALQPKVSE